MGALTDEQKRRFAEDGFLVVPGVLTADQVRDVRAFLRPKFGAPEYRQPGDTANILFDVYNRFPEARWLLFHPPTVAALRDLLGPDYVVLRESSAHHMMYGGWHKDTTAQEKAGHTFQWDPDYLMVEVAYYLQDNTPEYGGGLDVEVGTHTQPDLIANPPPAAKPGLIQRAVNKAARLAGVAPADRTAYPIPSKAGDLVVFDFRVNHKATPKRQEPKRQEQEKLALFAACSRNTRHVQQYHQYIAGRPDYAYLTGYVIDPGLAAAAAAANVTLA